MKLRCMAVLMVLFHCVACFGDDVFVGVETCAIETFIIEPAVIESISIWVPAVRSGPIINRSCRAKENQEFSYVLSATVKHNKTEECFEQTARILAELTSIYQKFVPLGIFNGWQWENANDMCQFESGSYNLAPRGGCWENSWEGVLDLSSGAIGLKRLDVESTEKFSVGETMHGESTIEVRTFSSIRTRDGYPKERQL